MQKHLNGSQILYSWNLGQKTLSRCKHHLVHCIMCMHDVFALSGLKTNVRNHWPPPHDLGQGTAISHIIRQAYDVLMCPPKEV